ncbi:HNH endonuclease [Gordonia phage RedWattleHog]|uniref:HNH endonuclease n=1 Tax=Gordonia phage Stormageddon TaxID=2656541 RepID=A0A649VS84_9CAUD|nr:HNH endonuclease [Gordonia phage Stormageddon]QGJ94865.1 HNH endonuclease [Gordonia phage Stormageddon]QLF83506.1 HNH endonuclease [Gordonia phage RedWattleHog]
MPDVAAKPSVQCKDCAAAGITRPRKVHQVKVKGQLRDAPGKRCREHFYARRKVVRQRSRDLRIEDVYTLSPEEFEELFIFQGRCCFICEKAKGKTRALHVDHDHTIEDRRESIRGLLCSTCNRILLGRYTIAMLLRAIDYQLDPPAQRYFRAKERAREIEEAGRAA